MFDLPLSERKTLEDVKNKLIVEGGLEAVVYYDPTPAQVGRVFSKLANFKLEQN
jgi:hypothetical protein